VADDASFARLVSLACHDLRTPLATVFGFARTLSRLDELSEKATGYAGMIETASSQLAELLDELSLAARIESGRYEPSVEELDSITLLEAAAERLGAERVAVGGTGGAVVVDPAAARRAVAALVQCALRHGGLEQVDAVADGAELRVRPITPASAPVVVGESLRDLGAAVAVKLIRHVGGAVEVEEDVLRVRLPAASPG
jgi:signal transduction histidine kinase